MDIHRLTEVVDCIHTRAYVACNLYSALVFCFKCCLALHDGSTKIFPSTLQDFFWSNIRNKFCSSEVLLDNYYISNVVLWAYCISIIKRPRDVAPYKKKGSTVHILCIGTDRSQQTVQTKIRLLLKKQSDQGLRCLPFHQHLLDALMQCYIKLFYF